MQGAQSTLTVLSYLVKPLGDQIEKAFREEWLLPGNAVENPNRRPKGQHSIRVNQQWRICFIWKDGDAYDVEFCDYH
ncbi:MAG: type II toxin-antitoxin system RelE/ParE family toxin [Parvibaculaceae bacterium]